MNFTLGAGLFLVWVIGAGVAASSVVREAATGLGAG